MTPNKRGLGKGLDALFENLSESNSTPAETFSPKEVTEIRITEVEPRRDQPRKNFDPESLEALSESIRLHGVIQPIILGEKQNGFYPIIAGERRWRAAKMAGLTVIPAVVRDYEQQEIMEIALIENLQREDLNPIEEAQGYKNLMTAFGLTQEEVSEKIGKSRSAIANTLRLLSLSDAIKQLISDGDLSNGHARALLTINEEEKRLELAEKVIREGLSVRELERLTGKKVPAPKKEKTPRKYDAEFADCENRLSQQMGTKVKIVNGEKKGKIEIEYYGNDDLNRILTILGNICK